MIYLCTPYSHPDALVREERFQTACKIAGRLMNQGHVVYAPICHSHPIAVLCRLPGTWDYWERVDRHFLSMAREVWVVKMDGWTKSTGISKEISIATDMGKPIRYLDVPTIIDTNWPDLRPQP